MLSIILFCFSDYKYLKNISHCFVKIIEVSLTRNEFNDVGRWGRSMDIEPSELIYLAQ